MSFGKSGRGEEDVGDANVMRWWNRSQDRRIIYTMMALPPDRRKRWTDAQPPWTWTLSGLAAGTGLQLGHSSL